MTGSGRGRSSSSRSSSSSSNKRLQGSRAVEITKLRVWPQPGWARETRERGSLHEERYGERGQEVGTSAPCPRLGQRFVQVPFAPLY